MRFEWDVHKDRINRRKHKVSFATAVLIFDDPAHLMKKPLTEEQVKELNALRDVPDEAIDTTDIPPLADWDDAVVGKFYRPVKQAVTIRLDADVLAWLRREGKGYQTRVNAILRQAMKKSRKPAA